MIGKGVVAQMTRAYAKTWKERHLEDSGGGSFTEPQRQFEAVKNCGSESFELCLVLVFR